jgi:Flp pilus assembly protein TadB
MDDTGGRNEDDSTDDPPRRPPLQFSLRGLFIVTTAVALVFGTLRWLGVSPEASGFILVVLIIAAAAAAGLMVAILRE